MAKEINQLDAPKIAADMEPDAVVVDTATHEDAPARPESKAKAEEKKELEPAKPKQFVDETRNEIIAKARSARKSDTTEFKGSDTDPGVLFGAHADKSELAIPLGETPEAKVEPEKTKAPLNGIDPALLGQKVKVIVNGAEREITVEEALRNLQMNDAADQNLARSKEILRQTQEFQRTAHQPPAGAPEKADSKQGDESGKGKPTGEPAQLDARQLAEKLQFGTTEEAAAVIQALLEKQGPQAPAIDVDKAVDGVLENRQTQKEVTTYVQQYPEIIDDPIFQATIVQFSHRAMAEDLLQAGLTMDQLRGAVQSPTDLTRLYREARLEGMPVRTPQQILEVGHSGAVQWRTGQPLKAAGTPTPTPRVNLQERQERKANLQLQPEQRRQPTASSNIKTVSQDQSRASRFEEMKRSRFQPV